MMETCSLQRPPLPMLIETCSSMFEVLALTTSSSVTAYYTKAMPGRDERLEEEDGETVRSA